MSLRSKAETIGVARLNAQGVLQLSLRAEGPEGTVGHSRLMMTLEQAKAKGFRFSSEPEVGKTVQVLAVEASRTTGIVAGKQIAPTLKAAKKKQALA